MSSSKAIEPGADDAASEKPELLQNFDILRTIPAFAGLSYKLMKLYAYLARRKTFAAGVSIFQAGQQANQAHVVIRGRVELYIARGNHEIELQIIEEQGFFGYMALLAKFEWPIGAKALTQTELLVLDRTRFQQLVRQFPAESMQVIEKLVQMKMGRMQQHMQTLVENATDDEQRRLLLQMERDY